MKRTIWGAIMLVVGNLLVIATMPRVLGVLASEDPDVRTINRMMEHVDYFILGLIIGVVGFFLLRSGLNASHQKSVVEHAALAMIRAGGKIDFPALAHKAGMSEPDVRRIVKQSQTDGGIPTD